MNAIALEVGRTLSSQGTECVTPSLGPQESSGEFLLWISDTPSHLPNTLEHLVGVSQGICSV